MSNQLGMGSTQPRLRFDYGDQALSDMLKGNTIELACYLQRILVQRVTDHMKPPILAIDGYPPDFKHRSVQPRVSLNHRL